MGPAQKKLEGKIALVTGAAQRIGHAVALALADHGIHVAIHYNSSRREAEESRTIPRCVRGRLTVDSCFVNKHSAHEVYIMASGFV